MPTMRICFLAILCFLVPGLSYGQTPGPGVSTDKPNNQNTNPQKNPETDQPGTDQSPFIVKVLTTTPSEPPPTPDASQEKHKPPDWDWWWDKTPEIFIALFTLMLFIATRRLVTGADDTARRQLRAYISVVKAFQVDNHDLTAYATNIRNSGQTPAYAIKCWRGIGIQKHPLTSRLSPPAGHTPDTDVVLGNGAELGFNDEIRPQFSPREMGNVKTGKAAIYVWGRIEYLDCFERKHFTDFCLFQTEPGGGPLMHSHIGNDAD